MAAEEYESGSEEEVTTGVTSTLQLLSNVLRRLINVYIDSTNTKVSSDSESEHYDADLAKLLAYINPTSAHSDTDTLDASEEAPAATIDTAIESEAGADAAASTASASTDKSASPVTWHPSSPEEFLELLDAYLKAPHSNLDGRTDFSSPPRDPKLFIKIRNGFERVVNRFDATWCKKHSKNVFPNRYSSAMLAVSLMNAFSFMHEKQLDRQSFWNNTTWLEKPIDPKTKFNPTTHQDKFAKLRALLVEYSKEGYPESKDEEVSKAVQEHFYEHFKPKFPSSIFTKMLDDAFSEFNAAMAPTRTPSPAP